MKEVTLDAELRGISKKERNKLRNEGKVPAVFYGNKEKSLSMSVGAKVFDDALRAGGANILVTLNLGNEKKTAIVKEVQRDIISQKPIHVDFLAVDLNEKVEVNVPLHISGIAPGVKLSGGVMEHILREVKVRCLPTAIPQTVTVDVSALEINHSILVKDLPQIEGVEFISDPAGIIVNIVAPTILEEAPAPGTEAAAATATGAEPEVIAKGKKETEEAAAAEGEKKPAAKGGEKK
jgi:large subunit ribosomal protein L25